MSRFFPHTTALVILVLAWMALPGHSASGQIVLAPLRGSNAIVPDHPSTHAVDRQTAPGIAPARTDRSVRAAENTELTGRVEEGPLAHDKTPYARRAPAFTETVPLANLSFLPVVSLPAPALRAGGFRVLPLKAERIPRQTEAKRYRSPDDRSTGASASHVIAHDNERLKR